MLELCAREEENLRGGRGPWTERTPDRRDPGPRRPSSNPEAESTCAVSKPSRGKPLQTAVLVVWIFLFFTFPPATPPMSTLWDEHTGIAQCSTKCGVKRTPLSQPLSLNIVFSSRLALSLHVEGKMASNATTSLENKLVYRYLLISLHL